MTNRCPLAIAAWVSLALIACHRADTQTSTRATGGTTANRAIAPSAAASLATRSPAEPGPASSGPSLAPMAAGELARAPDEAWIRIDTENLFIPVIDDLDRELLSAQVALKEGNTREAAASLRRAAAYVRALPVKDTKAKSSLASTSGVLEAVAHELEQGQVDYKRLAEAFGRAHEADVAQNGSPVTPDVWASYSARPGWHLDRAVHEIQTDPKAAAVDIREANSYLKMELLRHPTGLLDRAVRELDDLAGRVASGKTKDPRRVEDAIADSGHALAQMHYDLAIGAWKRHDRETTVSELGRSTRHLEDAVVHARDEIRTAAKALHQDAEKLKVDVRADAGAVLSRLETELERVKTEFARLRGKAKPGG